MDFGILNAMQQRYQTKTATQILHEAVEQAKVAEQLGFGRMWYVEHHFSNYSICPSPLMMVAHLASQTTTIRLGTGVVVAPLYQPPRLLAEIAMVDTLSNGRLEVGVGTGYQDYEFARFGEDLALRSEKTIEVLELIHRGLTKPSFSHDGKHYKQPVTAINVRPIQQPYPPVWLAGTDPMLHRTAARFGFNIFLSGQAGSTRRLGRFLDTVRDSFRAEGADPNGFNLGLLRAAFVTESKKEAEHYADCLRYQQRLAVALKRRQEKVVDNYMVAEVPYEDELPLDKIASNLMVGDPHRCAELAVQEIEALGVNHLVIQPQIGDIAIEPALRSMERWMTEVVPLIEKGLGKPIKDINPMKSPKPLPAAAE